MKEFTRIRWEEPAEGVGRLMLAREDMRNAQDIQMLYEIDECLVGAMQRNDIKVVIIGADGPHFSSGHDLADRNTVKDFQPVTEHGGYDEPEQHGHMATEQEVYLGFCWRWRNLPKPTIVQVQGKVIAGGLMLVWPFDIVIASEDAQFCDPVVAFGVNGHEFFTHVWELGQRKAKEMLFTGAYFSAEECHRLGSVNHVVKREELESTALDMAKRIASRPAMGLKLAKLAVNQSLDAQGQWSALQSAFGLHHLGHAQQRILHKIPIDPAGAKVIRADAKAS